MQFEYDFHHSCRKTASESGARTCDRPIQPAKKVTASATDRWASPVVMTTQRPVVMLYLLLRKAASEVPHVYHKETLAR